MINEKSNKIKQLNEEIAKLSDENYNLNEKMKKLESNLTFREVEYKRIKNKFNLLNSEIEKFNNNIIDLKTKNKKLLKHKYIILEKLNRIVNFFYNGNIVLIKGLGHILHNLILGEDFDMKKIPKLITGDYITELNELEMTIVKNPFIKEKKLFNRFKEKIHFYKTFDHKILQDAFNRLNSNNKKYEKMINDDDFKKLAEYSQIWKSHRNSVLVRKDSFFNKNELSFDQSNIVNLLEGIDEKSQIINKEKDEGEVIWDLLNNWKNKIEFSKNINEQHFKLIVEQFQIFIKMLNKNLKKKEDNIYEDDINANKLSNTNYLKAEKKNSVVSTIMKSGNFDFNKKSSNNNINNIKKKKNNPLYKSYGISLKKMQNQIDYLNNKFNYILVVIDNKNLEKNIYDNLNIDSLNLNDEFDKLDIKNYDTNKLIKLLEDNIKIKDKVLNNKKMMFFHINKIIKQEEEKLRSKINEINEIEDDYVCKQSLLLEIQNEITNKENLLRNKNYIINNNENIINQKSEILKSIDLKINIKEKELLNLEENIKKYNEEIKDKFSKYKEDINLINLKEKVIFKNKKELFILNHKNELIKNQFEFNTKQIETLVKNIDFEKNKFQDIIIEKIQKIENDLIENKKTEIIEKEVIVEKEVEKIIEKEIEKIVEKEVIIEKPIEVIVEKEVEVIVEKEVIIEKPVEVIVEKEVEKIIEKEVIVEKIIEKEVEKIVEKEVIIEKPIKVIVEKEVEKIVEKEVIIEKPVEVIVEKEVEKIIEKEEIVEKIIEKEVEKIVEKEVIIEKPIEVIVEKEVIIEKPVEKIIEIVVEKPIEVIIEKPIEKIIEMVVEKPIEKIVEKIIEKPVEVIIEKPIELNNYKNDILSEEILNFINENRLKLKDERKNFKTFEYMLNLLYENDEIKKNRKKYILMLFTSKLSIEEKYTKINDIIEKLKNKYWEIPIIFSDYYINLIFEYFLRSIEILKKNNFKESSIKDAFKLLQLKIKKFKFKSNTLSNVENDTELDINIKTFIEIVKFLTNL